MQLISRYDLRDYLRDDQDMAEILDEACEDGSLVFITKTLRSIASLKGMKDDELDKAFTLSRIKDCSQHMELSYKNCVRLLNSYGIEINVVPLPE